MRDTSQPIEPVKQLSIITKDKLSKDEISTIKQQIKSFIGDGMTVRSARRKAGKMYGVKIKYV